MNNVFSCECGVRTKQPFKINGQMLCAVCAEKIAPAIVASTARRWLDQYPTPNGDWYSKIMKRT